MLRRKLYAIFAKTVVSPEKLLPLLPAHLECLIGLEKRGLLFASGPLTDVGAGPLTGGGSTFLRVASAAEAREIAEADPVRDFRSHYFGARKRLTKKRCGEFFSNDRNFLSLWGHFSPVSKDGELYRSRDSRATNSIIPSGFRGSERRRLRRSEPFHNRRRRGRSPGMIVQFGMARSDFDVLARLDERHPNYILPIVRIIKPARLASRNNCGVRLPCRSA
jgi:uncharacterized protein YciI